MKSAVMRAIVLSVIVLLFATTERANAQSSPDAEGKISTRSGEKVKFLELSEFRKTFALCNFPTFCLSPYRGQQIAFVGATMVCDDFSDYVRWGQKNILGWRQMVMTSPEAPTAFTSPFIERVEVPSSILATETARCNKMSSAKRKGKHPIFLVFGELRQDWRRMPWRSEIEGLQGWFTVTDVLFLDNFTDDGMFDLNPIVKDIIVGIAVEAVKKYFKL